MLRICFVMLFGLFGMHVAVAQIASCCNMPATVEFAAFAGDKAFNAGHLNPKPYVHSSDAGGKMISIEVPGGTKANAYLIPAKKPSSNYIFVIHEWWGLNDHIKREAEKLFNDLENVNVLALDLYDGKVATTREEASQYMQAVKSERAMAIIKAARTYAGQSSEIATIGWCFGGGWSLQTSLTLGDQAAGCIIYYGMPEKDVEKLKALQADVLGIFAKQDGWITPEIVKDFEANMKAAGKSVTIHEYDAKHAFANPSNPQYDSAATKDAYQRSIQFLQKCFQ